MCPRHSCAWCAPPLPTDSNLTQPEIDRASSIYAVGGSNPDYSNWYARAPRAHRASMLANCTNLCMPQESPGFNTGAGYSVLDCIACPARYWSLTHFVGDYSFSCAVRRTARAVAQQPAAPFKSAAFSSRCGPASVEHTPIDLYCSAIPSQ